MRFYLAVVAVCCCISPGVVNSGSIAVEGIETAGSRMNADSRSGGGLPSGMAVAYDGRSRAARFAKPKHGIISGKGGYISLPPIPEAYRSMKGTDGNDVLEGTAMPDAMSGYDGNDILTGSAKGDSLNGGEGTDTADYRSSDAGVMVSLAKGEGRGGQAEGDNLFQIENVVGSDFDDSLIGHDGENKLHGGQGDDLLTGYSGVDELIGGPGNDTFFVYAAGNAVTIADFTPGAQSDDRIDLADFPDFTSLRDVLDASYAHGPDVIIDLGPRDIVKLRNLMKSDLHEDDFRFAGSHSGDVHGNLGFGEKCDARTAMRKECEDLTDRSSTKIVEQVFRSENHLDDCSKAEDLFYCRSNQTGWLVAARRMNWGRVRDCLSDGCGGAVVIDRHSACVWTPEIVFPQLDFDRDDGAQPCSDLEYSDTENEFRMRLTKKEFRRMFGCGAGGCTY